MEKKFLNYSLRGFYATFFLEKSSEGTFLRDWESYYRITRQLQDEIHGYKEFLTIKRLFSNENFGYSVEKLFVKLRDKKLIKLNKFC